MKNLNFRLEIGAGILTRVKRFQIGQRLQIGGEVDSKSGQ